MPLWLARVTEEAAHEELAEYWLDPDITGGTATEIFQIAADKAEIFVGTAIEKQRGIAIQSLGYDQQLLDAVRADRVEDLVEAFALADGFLAVLHDADQSRDLVRVI